MDNSSLLINKIFPTHETDQLNRLFLLNFRVETMQFSESKKEIHDACFGKNKWLEYLPSAVTRRRYLDSLCEMQGTVGTRNNRYLGKN